ncbi:MAG: hypothetical protein GXY89_01690 [Tissierellia bacterium]|jgi:uncharacterized membrane protein YczE|nr:hypothetical protein [Tissierellia bacterium]
MNKNNLIKRVIVLFFGIYLYGLALTFIIFCGIGMDAWNVFHDGLSKISGISLGYMSIIVSVIMMVVAMISGEPLGIGTIVNGLFVGTFVQIHMNSGIFKVQTTLFMGLLYLLIGMVLLGFASYFYMKTGLGSGPRDSFNLALSKKTGLKMGHAKSLVEVVVVIMGAILGGSFGLATVLGAVFTGIIVQWIFDLMKFEPKSVKHESVKDTFYSLRR